MIEFEQSYIWIVILLVLYSSFLASMCRNSSLKTHQIAYVNHSYHDFWTDPDESGMEFRLA
jgi:hypothetical protein